jgi:hypothetical protein
MMDEHDRSHAATPGAHSSLFVVGDLHGEHIQTMSLLLDAGIIDDNLHWAAADARLWFVGDLADRGPDGIGAIDLVRGLQAQAALAGGLVESLFGNHDLLLLMAHRFGDRAESAVTGLSFLGEWLAGGGQRADLAGMSAERADWLARRPAMALVDDQLLVHSDSLWYLEYGQTIAQVNAAVRAVLAGDDPIEWDRLLGAMSSRFAFDAAHGGSVDAARLLLATFGGRQVIHGHTPIPSMIDRPADDIHAALVYAGGLAVNVDGGMFMGGAGIVFEVQRGTVSTNPSSA